MSGSDAENHFAIDVSMFQVSIPNNDTPSGLFYYVLATPTYEVITNEELINQLEEIELLEGLNNITVIGNLPVLLKLDYYTSSLQGRYEYLDSKSVDLTDYYNKTETDALLDEKANVSDIPDTSNFITKDVNNLTNYTKTSDLSSVATSGNYNDLSNKPTIPTIPTNVSTFTNDAGYITNSVNNLTNYTTTTDMNTALGNKQNVVLSGTTDPTSSLGEDGDIYLQYE
jgi:hypothetical protein